MIKRGDKSGQFYLVAAVVLAAIIIGISAISNYVKKQGNPQLEELKEEIQIEASKTLDYGIANELSSAQINQLMKNFTDYYIIYEGTSGKDLYFLFGNSNNITVKGYQKTDKTIRVVSGSSQATITQTSGNFTGSFDPNESWLILYVDENTHNFNLSSSENFYFVLMQEFNGAEYVIVG